MEIPKHSRKNHPHFSIGQVLANAVMRSRGKGLEHTAVIRKNGDDGSCLASGRPAFGDEVVGGVEICRGLVRGMLMD